MTTTVTLSPLPMLPTTTTASTESDYEKIIGSSGDGEIHVGNSHRDSNGSMEYGGYTKLTPTRSQPQSFHDDMPLYATVDKSRTGAGSRLTPTATAAIAAALRQGSSPASTTT